MAFAPKEDLELADDLPSDLTSGLKIHDAAEISSDDIEDLETKPIVDSDIEDLE